MNNKKFIFLCTLFTFFVLNPVYSSDLNVELKEDESVKITTSHHATQNISSEEKTWGILSKGVMKRIGWYSDLSTLSTLCCVNKSFQATFENDLNHLLVDVFYKKVIANSEFFKKFFEQENSFQEGLKYLVFKEGSQDHSLAAYKLIRNLPYRSETMRDYWIQMKPEYFKGALYEGTIVFNYCAVFKLYLRQEKLSYLCFYKLEKSFFLADQILKGKNYVAAEKQMPILIEDYKAQKNNSKLKPIFYDLIILYRNIYLEKNSLTSFFENPSSVEALEFIQKLPINFTNYKEQIPILMEKIKNDTLVLGKERAQIIHKLRRYSLFG